MSLIAYIWSICFVWVWVCWSRTVGVRRILIRTNDPTCGAAFTTFVSCFSSLAYIEDLFFG
jgi:hypothetical protein